MKYIILCIISAALLCSCASQSDHDRLRRDFDLFRYDSYRALDSLRHGQYPRYDGPTWEMR